MQTITIHTWKCQGCGYAQDFEPTKELMDQHFNKSEKFKLSDVKENECPACALGGVRQVALPKETDNAKKMKMKINEAGDIEAKRQELIAQGKSKVNTGFKETRLETDEEKSARIEAEIERSPLRTKTQQNALRTTLTAQANITREFPVFREETDEEQTERINKKLSGMKEATPEQIAELKAKYEDA